MKQLPHVRPGLLRHSLDKQVLVYDPRDDRVHLLDPTTACIFELLEEGGWSAERIPSELARRLNVASDESFLPLALDELRKADLLDSGSPQPVLAEVNRRDLVRKLAAAGAATFLVPAIATLTATRGYAQTTPAGGQGQTCSQCTSSTQCLSGTCGTQGACNSALKPNGVTCLSNNNCCSNNCTGVSNKLCAP